MNDGNQRLLLYARDIMSITGMSERSAYRLLAKTRKDNPGQIRGTMSIDHFVKYTGLSEKRILQTLQ